MKSWMKIGLFVIIVAAVIAVVQLTGIGSYLTWENLQENKETMLQYTQDNYILAVSVFIVLYIAVAALSLPGATLATLAGGFMFGPIFGTLYVNIAATTGATLVFLIARFLLGSELKKKYEDKLEKFDTEIRKNGFRYLMTLRLIPLFPFWAVNLFAGLTTIPIRTYIWTTAVGIIPGSFVYAYAGSRLSEVESLGDIMSPQMISALVLLGLLVLFPTVYEKLKKKPGESEEK
jgi:uncharacterized membrane protein YdjX (TVP38/TMEM64 family)